MMSEVFDKLKTLQDILWKKHEIQREILEIPKALNTRNELLNRLKKSYIDKNDNYEATKERIRRLRIRLDDAERLREGYEKQMDQISTQREYEALDKEIKDATEKEQKYRKEIIREEKELDELRETLSREEAMISHQEEELAAEQNKIKSESNAKKEELKVLEKAEKEVVPGLDDEMLFKFDRIIKSKSGVGIVPVKGMICTGCHMVLPAQFQNDVRIGEKILFCPYCSRILFYDESAEESEGFQEEYSESLADLVNYGDIDNLEEKG